MARQMKRNMEAKPLRIEMAVSWKRMVLAVVMGSVFMWTLGAGAETAAAAADRPRLSGAFIQIDNDIANWTAERWGRELDAMHAVGMDLIVIQYVGSGRTMYYPSRLADREALPDESVQELVWQGKSPFSARCVRVEISPSAKQWTMLAELSIYTSDGKNVAAGKPYTLDPSPSGNYQDPRAATGGKVTDGSFKFSWGDMVGFEYPKSNPAVVIDLGLAADGIVRVTGRFMRSEISAVGLPVHMKVSASSAQGGVFEAIDGDVSWQGVGSAPPDSVGMAINEAAKRNMQVMLGLTLDPSWWKGNFDAAGDLERNKQVVDELWSRYGRSPAFYGWYIPHEIDDLNSRGADRLNNLIRFTAELSGYAKQVSSGKPVAIAPFFGMHMTPAEYEKWWKSYLAGARVDIVMLQDGVGCHRVDLYKDVPSYYAALQRAATANNVELWSDVEVFNQTHGWPVDGGTWAAVPGKIETIAEQLRVEKPYVSRFVAFEFTHYMSPWQGSEQAKLFDEYRKYLEQ
ncbi:MAG: DUF4434 domain-containing protein [Bacillota bacterium]